jgi:tetratricopeptide (TPR) repeat protein
MPERETATRAEIAQRVVYWRKRRGLTRQLFADRMGRSLCWVDVAAVQRQAAYLDEMHYTDFGTTNVLIHRVAALVRLCEAGRALEFAATIDPAAIAALSAERRANYLLDLTEAYSRTGDYRQAVQCLHQAEHVAPEEVRCRPVAHGLLRSLLDNTSGESARLVRGMATRAGVTA